MVQLVCKEFKVIQEHLEQMVRKEFKVIPERLEQMARKEYKVQRVRKVFKALLD
jgi:hypothetical protein